MINHDIEMKYHIILKSESKALEYRERADECAAYGDRIGVSYWTVKAREREAIADAVKQSLLLDVAAI